MAKGFIVNIKVKMNRLARKLMRRNKLKHKYLSRYLVNCMRDARAYTIHSTLDTITVTIGLYKPEIEATVEASDE